MAGRTILVTGVTRYVGSALAGRLIRTPGVDRVIGVDAALPETAARIRMGEAEFARADIRNPLISRIIDAAEVDTVVHASASATPAASAARSMAKEMNVLGTMQLLAACQQAPTLRHLVVRSTDAVYGGSSKDPAVLTEEMTARSVPSSGPIRDAVDIEGYVRGFARRRPDVRVAVPRFAPIIGPTVRTPLTRYLSLSPLVPVVAGTDGRLQLVHESDAVAVLEHLALGEFSGIANVAGDGVLMLTQAIHRAGRFPLPVPGIALGGVGTLLQMTRLAGFSADQARLLVTGRVMDTSLLRSEVRYRPRFTTAGAFDDFVAAIGKAVDPETVRRVEVRIATAVGAAPQDVIPAGPRSGTQRPRLVGIDGLAPRRRRPRAR